MSDEVKFDAWMRDPYRWEPGDGPYVGYALHYSNQTLSEITETLHLTAYCDVAIVAAGKRPFVQDSKGQWSRSEDLYMIAQCTQPLAVLPGASESLAELFRQGDNESKSLVEKTRK